MTRNLNGRGKRREREEKKILDPLGEMHEKRERLKLKMVGKKRERSRKGTLQLKERVYSPINNYQKNTPGALKKDESKEH